MKIFTCLAATAIAVLSTVQASPAGPFRYQAVLAPERPSHTTPKLLLQARDDGDDEMKRKQQKEKEDEKNKEGKKKCVQDKCVCYPTLQCSIINADYNAGRMSETLESEVKFQRCISETEETCVKEGEDCQKKKEQDSSVCCSASDKMDTWCIKQAS